MFSENKEGKRYFNLIKELRAAEIPTDSLGMYGLVENHLNGKYPLKDGFLYRIAFGPKKEIDSIYMDIAHQEMMHVFGINHHGNNNYFGKCETRFWIGGLNITCDLFLETCPEPYRTILLFNLDLIT